MPNILYLWDFEDGSTQGWELGPYTTLDNSGAIQGTYSLKYDSKGDHCGDINDLLAKISGIDLSSVTKPMIVFILKDSSDNTWGNYELNIKVVVKDQNGNELVSKEIHVTKQERDFVRVVVIDISEVAGNSNLTIEIIESGHIGYNTISGGCFRRINYIDMIAIVDGADYEYSTGILTSENSEIVIDLNVPDSDLSSDSPSGVGVVLATPDWDHTSIKFTAVTDQGSITINSDDDKIKNTNYSSYGTSISTFSSISIDAKISIGSELYSSWDEKVAVVFIDSLYNYKKIYLFVLHFSHNPVRPSFNTAINTTTYGTTVSGQKDFNVKIHGESLSVALNVRYIVGDHTVVTTGSVSLEIYDSSIETLYGSAQIDLTSGDNITSTYISDLPTDTDLVFRIKWSIQASARVVLMVTPIFKVG